MNKKILYISSLTVLLILALSFVISDTTQAATDKQLHGWAWSDNIGWVSFASSTADDNQVEYGVKELNNGQLSGWAWSDNVGWIKFDTSFNGPDGQGDNFAAKVTGNTLRGWARACAGTVSGTCADTASRTDGWDGWIKFTDTTIEKTSTNASPSGSASPSVVTVTKYKGFSWGDVVIGWLNLYPGYSLITGTTCQGVCDEPPPKSTPDISLSCAARVTTGGNLYTYTTGPVTVRPGDSVDWKANPRNAKGTVTYAWTDATYDSAAQISKAKVCTANATYSPSVTGTDSSKTANVSCPVVKCEEPSVDPSVAAYLYAAPSVGDLTNNTATNRTTIEVGQTAGIKSKVESTEDRLCTVSGEYTNEPVAVRPNSSATAGIEVKTFTTHVFDTPGTYVYKVNCKLNGALSTTVSSAEAIVEVKTKTKIEEI